MFDFSKVETQDYGPVPAGIYPAYVDRVEFKTPKSGGADYLSIGFKIFGEKQENRMVFNNYNLFHATDKVKNIAMSQLKSFMIASGLTEEQMNFNTKEALVAGIANCRCMIKVDIRKSEGYGDQNTIKGYQELDETLENFSSGTGVNAEDIPF